MDALVVLIPLMPFLAAMLIGAGNFAGLIKGEQGESTTGIIAVWSISMSVLLALVLLGADLGGKNAGNFMGGYWLSSDNAAIRFDFVTSGFNVRVAALFALLLMLVMKFSINNLHREAGFHRYFCFLSLFSTAIFLIVLADSAVLTFVGWEIAGLCSYLLIAFRYERMVAAENATQVFCINRIGDAAFLLGIGLSYVWLEGMTWSGLNTAAADLTKGQAAALAACFVVAALAKSAQLPFSPWLNKAMEGPTPSSAVFYGAVMIHAGVFLVIQLQPLIAHSPSGQVLLIASGGATLLYSFLAAKTQTDVKSSQVFAILSQLSLMFIECGFDFWELAQWHLCAHATVRCYSMLTAPSLIHNVKDNPVKPVPAVFGTKRRLFLAAFQRFWLVQINDWAWARPLRRLSRDLSYFDDNFVDQVMGVPVPAMHAAASLAQQEESALAPDAGHNRMVAGTGLVGKVMSWLAGSVHWFEERLVLQGIARDALYAGRALGYFANKFETMILRPRYLVLFVFITFLVAF
jgi:NADH:ubiquinone oxidoreductase subunit 5 (subunit L)/multisubunit Na+/H+ antiporter MnhA subunit